MVNISKVAWNTLVDLEGGSDDISLPHEENNMIQRLRDWLAGLIMALRLKLERIIVHISMQTSF
jgi:hypothetical protein